MKYLFWIVIIGLILSGCNKTIENNVKEVNCNDGNTCTVDTKTAIGECSYAKINNCCGNGICELDEGCDSIKKATACHKDCEVCAAEIRTRTIGCEGNCEVMPDSIKIKGDSKITFQVENIGEKEIKVFSEFSCSKLAQGTGKVYLAYYGLTDQAFIENGQNNEIDLKGKTKTLYKLTLRGKPTQTIILQCEAKFREGKNTHIEPVFFRLES